MTPSQIIGLAAIAILGVLVGFTIPTLIQLRRTAQAVEQFVRSTAPRIESATSNLDSVLGRMDRVMRGMEDGTRGITGAIGNVGAFISHLRPPASTAAGPSTWLAALSTMLSGLWQAWNVVATAPQRGPAPSAPPQGGRTHE